MISRPLSIVHVLAPAPYGGLETVVETLSAGQMAAGDRPLVVPILTPSAPMSHPFLEAMRASGVPLQEVRVGGRGYLSERAQIRRLLAEHGAKVLHTHGYRADVVDGPLARQAGAVAISTVHGFVGGSWRNRIYERLQVRAYHRCAAVVAVSDALQAQLIQQGLGTNRVKMIRNAWKGEGEQVGRTEARAQLGLSDEPVIGFVGRLSEEKGPDVLIRSFALMDQSATLVVIGAGPLEDRCRALVTELGVDSRVRWMGAIPKAGSLLRAFDLLALTSWTEGTPMTVLEAMWAGVPLVVTSVGGVPDVVSPREAVLCPPGDVDTIASALDGVLLDPDAARVRAVAARHRLDREFAVEPWVERYREVYEEVLTASPG